MEEIEKIYTQSLIQHFKPVGDILEIGFCESSALEIKKHRPKSHTVIESDPHRAEKAKTLSFLTLIESAWTHAFASLGDFDAIIINGYPAAATPKQKVAIVHFEQAKHLLEEEKKIVKMVEEIVPNLMSIQYSDEDLDSFLAKVDPGMEENVLRFLESLRNNGQILQSQYEQCLETYDLMQKKPVLYSFWKYPDHFLQFLSLSTAKLRKGGRLCCYIDKNSSKYDDPKFFAQIITNPSLNYEEKTIHIASSEALMMLLQKV